MRVYETVGEIPLPAYGEGDAVAIKLHMGERGNLHYVRPGDVAVLVDRIKASGAQVFIGDTTTLYKRKRSTIPDYLETAALNGFTQERIGCPIVIADEIGGRQVGRVEIAEGFLRANSLLTFSHATGHITAGFAGAIKNIAMGCATRAGKSYIHSPGCPKYDREKCAFCGDCVEACPFDFISLEDGIEIELEDCPACGRCLTACENGALYQPEGAMVECYRRYAETCRAILDLFDNAFFINDLRRITKFCDCTVNSEPIISDDIGLIAGGDPIQIDSKSVEIISGRSPDAMEVFGHKWRDFIGHVSRFMELPDPVE
jgi:uncharacterized Fe-S center protein